MIPPKGNDISHIKFSKTTVIFAFELYKLLRLIPIYDHLLHITIMSYNALNELFTYRVHKVMPIACSDNLKDSKQGTPVQTEG